MGAAPIQVDRQEDMTNLVGAFRDYAKAPKKPSNLLQFKELDLRLAVWFVTFSLYF